MNQHEPVLDLNENQEDWDVNAESRQRTTRFFYKHRRTEAPGGFDPDRSIRIATRHINWKGSVKDTKIQDGASQSEFEITGELGGGGMGTVYAARQKSVDREVALKMITPDLSLDKSFRDSFLREAIVTGNLSHPNIVAVHDLGRSGEGCLFYTMQKIVGTSWDKIIRKKSEEENIEILLKLSDAVAYAHSKGVLHRDLKPANVMLGNFGEVMLTDWGVAVSSGSFELSGKAVKLTKESDIEGTPAYMPPEMLDSDIHRIGPRSDIYLLGGILYEIVTGLHPHKINSGNLVHSIRHNLIQPTDKTGELVDIALKAMASEPEDRYADVKEFQHAIRNYQIHRESIRLTESADRHFESANGDYRAYASALYGYQEALRLWQDNHKAKNGLKLLIVSYAEHAFGKGDYDLALSILEQDERRHDGIVKRVVQAKNAREKRRRKIKFMYYSLAAAAVAVIAILTVSCLLVNKSRQKALREEALALTMLTQKEKENYYSLIALAANNLRLMNSSQAAVVLDQAPVALRGVEWQLLYALAKPRQAELKGHTDSVCAVSYSPDGQYLLSGGRDGQVRVWNASGNRQLHLLNFFTPIQKIKCAQDSKSALAIRSDRFLSLFSLVSGEVKTISAERAAINAADFLANRQQLIYGDAEGNLTVFDLLQKTPVTTFAGHRGGVTAIFCPPNAKRMITAGNDQTVKIWDADTFKLMRSIPIPTASVDAIAVCPSAGLIATGGDHLVRFWNWDTGELTTTIGGFSEPVTALAFSSDGKQLLTACANRLTIFSRTTMLPVKSFELDSGTIAYAAVFSPDDKAVATGDGNNLVTLWDADSRLDGRRSNFDTSRNPLAESPLSGAQVFAGDNYRLEVRFPDGRTTTLVGHEGKVNAAIFLGLSERIATCSNDTTVRIWNSSNGVMEKFFRGHNRYVSAIAATVDGKIMASAGWDGIVKIRDLGSDKELLSFTAHDEPVSVLEFSNDGKRLLSCSSSGAAIIWDAATGKRLLSMNGHNTQINAAAFSPDDRRVITAADDQTVRFWDAETGREIITLNPGQFTAKEIIFANNGNKLELHSAQYKLSWKLDPELSVAKTRATTSTAGK